MATTLAFLVIGGCVLFFAIALVPSIIDGAQALKERFRSTSSSCRPRGADALNADDAIDTAGNAAESTANFFIGSGRSSTSSAGS
jgi:hypothetical protein